MQGFVTTQGSSSVQLHGKYSLFFGRAVVVGVGHGDRGWCVCGLAIESMV
jgi:hypothetical protein